MLVVQTLKARVLPSGWGEVRKKDRRERTGWDGWLWRVHPGVWLHSKSPGGYSRLISLSITRSSRWHWCVTCLKARKGGSVLWMFMKKNVKKGKKYTHTHKRRHVLTLCMKTHDLWTYQVPFFSHPCLALTHTHTHLHLKPGWHCTFLLILCVFTHTTRLNLPFCTAKMYVWSRLSKKKKTKRLRYRQ